MIFAKNIMSKDVISTRPQCKVEEVIRVLYFHNISGLPVVNDDLQVIGMVSEADILGRKTGQDTVADIMSTPAVTISEETTLEEIATLLTEKKIKRVPVVRDKRLVGIVSRADVVRALARTR